MAPTEDPRNETAYVSADRNLTDLLQELRVVVPGVQVIFAFLLAVPFSERFRQVSPSQEKLYLLTLLSTAMAMALFIAPTAHHRLLFRKRDKEHIVVVANRFAVAGLGFLALSTCGAILLVTDVVFEPGGATLTTAASAIVLLTLWFVMPMVRRARLDDMPAPR